MNPDSTPHHPDGLAQPLPPMKSLAEATALAQKEHDPFYITAFCLRTWLGQLILQAVADYAEKKDPKTRSPQSGQAWRTLQETFGVVSQPSTFNSQLPSPSPSPTGRGIKGEGTSSPDSQPSALNSQLPRLLPTLLRFAKSDEPLAQLLRGGLVPLSIEHDCSGDYIGPKNKALLAQAPPALNPQPSTLNSLIERSLIRWCDWLDSAVHYQTHAQWHWNPVCFDPDPDKRELAILGSLQRHLADLSAPAQAAWQWHFAEAATRFKASPKWSTLGQAMSSDLDRLWPYREVDTLIISLWPLLKQHNWTYADLLRVMRPALRRPKAYPCEREQEFATYCNHVLGLHKTGKGVTAKDGRPAGYEVAQRLCALTAPKV